MPRFLLTPKWMLVHLVVALIVAGCFGLGRWQLNRLEQRRTENARIASQTALPPAGIEGLLSSTKVGVQEAEIQAYRRAVVRGSYDTKREVVLLTRSNGEQVGNHLLTPLVTPNGTAVIVDRGWVPVTMDTPPVAQAAPPQGPVEVRGFLLPSEGAAGLGSSRSGSEPLRATSRVDLTRLSEQLPYEIYPLYLRLQSQQPPSGRPLPQTVPLPPPTEGPHFSYAMQWFAFGVIALITYGALIRREAKNPREGAHSP